MVFFACFVVFLMLFVCGGFLIFVLGDFVLLLVFVDRLVFCVFVFLRFLLYCCLVVVRFVVCVLFFRYVDAFVD